ncbi:hypothetical protein PG994_013470 [Apiospora phragmitis]|uniref:Clr5 domain-containing protein n=1 Tax=Apiospora phragmitis TaxID=2905665 RepID=A0ABR1T8R1_9PEZI
MADVAFIQYTSEPVQTQSARIPRALWEEKKPQIIDLYEGFTLDEVIKKMAEAGFTASRRQYIYQLEQWGVNKYKVNHGEKSDSNNAFSSKRKHTAAGVASGNDQHGMPSSLSSLSSSHAKPFSKRLRMAVERMTGPNGDVVEKPAFDNLRRAVVAMGAKEAARAGSNSQAVTQSSYPIPGHPTKSPARESWDFVDSSESRWYAGEENDKIAREVFRLAKIVRSRPYPKNTRGPNTTANIQLYLQDIGDYLCGNKRDGEAFKFYTLMLKRLGDSCIRAVDMMTLLSSSEIDLLRSALLSLSKVIMEYVQDDTVSWEMGEGEIEEIDDFSYSTIFFQLLWRAQFDKSLRLLSALAKDVFAVRRKLYTPLPDLVGTCCSMLARRFTKYLQENDTWTQSTWRSSMHEVDLVGIVSRMEASEIHSDFVKCYYGRYAESRWAGSADWSDFRHHDYYNLPAGLINSLVSRNPAYPSDEDIVQKANRASSGTVDEYQSSPDMAMTPTSFQPRPVPRGSVDKYYLDPTLGTLCGSSLVSYGHMIEARAAMARIRKQAEQNEQNKPTKGTGEVFHRRCWTWRS